VKIVCAWCSAVILDDPGSETRVSHGICPECLYTFSHTDGVGLHKIMANLDIPIVVMDKDAVVVDANNAAAKAMHCSVERMVRLRGGVVLDCENARTHGGCGKSNQCSACQFRNTIKATFSDGKQRHGVVSEHPLGNCNGQAVLRLCFSAAKLGESVVITLEGREFVPGAASAQAQTG